MFNLLVLVLLIIVLTPFESVGQTIAKEVKDALSKFNTVPVIVTLKLPFLNDLELYDQRLTVRNIQNQVLETLTEEEFMLTERFNTIPGFAGLISWQGMEKLKYHSLVLHVGLDMYLSPAEITQIKPSLEESRPLIGIIGPENWTTG